jgi:hypothetical protein
MEEATAAVQRRDATYQPTTENTAETEAAAAEAWVTVARRHGGITAGGSNDSSGSVTAAA